jgi:hypothetical protein
MAKRDNTKKSGGKQASKARARKTSAASTSKKRTTKGAAKKRTTTKKTTTKKQSTKQSVGMNARIKALTSELHGLRGLHVLSAAVFAGLIAFVYTVMETVERTKVISYAATDALREDALAPAIQNFLTIDLRHLLAAGLGIAAVYSLFIATRGWNNYIARAKKGTVVSRWLIAAILGVIGLKVSFLLVGVFDVLLLSVLAVMLIGATYLAYRADVETVKKRKANLFLTAVVTAAVVVLAAVVFIATSMWHGVTLPISNYIVVDFFALGLLGYGVNQLFSLKKRKGFAKSEEVERNYVLVTTAATALFAGTLIIAFIS